MRSKFEGFSVEPTGSSSTLEFAVHYYGEFIQAFPSYADCLIHIRHWAYDAQSFVLALDQEFESDQWRALQFRTAAANNYAEAERLRDFP